MKYPIPFLTLALITATVSAREFHVSVKGDDNNDGSPSSPFKTISAAAKVAQPGDVITVHEGTYRERVIPPRGGTSDDNRIVYQAAPGEQAVIKGSEVVRDWKPFAPQVWKLTLPNSFFGKYNPYKDLIVGDWFTDKGRPHHTGEVYLNGKSLWETHLLEQVLHPKPFPGGRDPEGALWSWFCESDDKNTYIYANFHDKNPDEELVEINVRDACFYPDKTGRNYITVRGFRMCQAATQWAPPTAEQIGLIGPHWSKGWLIENNVISDSKCSGISLGKERATGQNVWTKDPCKGGDIHYNEVVKRAFGIDPAWSRENIGSHIVRNNTIFNCEQTGICGSLGAAFSQITNNNIYNIWTKRQFAGAEIAGIKIHAAIDVRIQHNRLCNCGRGLWLDWMAQGTRVTGNLLYRNTTDDLLSEVNHGPYLFDNNIFLSETAIYDVSQGGAFVHNLICGKIGARSDSRRTPYHLAHSTALGGLTNIAYGDDRFINNIFVGGNAAIPERDNPKAQKNVGYGLEMYNKAKLPVLAEGNVYFKNAKPCATETNFLDQSGFDPEIKIVEEGDGVYLEMTLPPSLRNAQRPFVTTKLLGNAIITGLPYENVDGTPLQIGRDFLGKQRNPANPFVGPFEDPGKGRIKIRVW